MIDCYTAHKDEAVPVQLLLQEQFESWLAGQDEAVKNWVKVNQFEAKSGQVCTLAGQDGKLSRVLLGLRDAEDVFQVGALPQRMPAGVYQLESDLSDRHQRLASLAWGLGSYQFTAYKSMPPIEARLALSSGVDSKDIETQVQAVFLVRDLINTPTEDMGPPELAEAAATLAERFDAEFQQIVGDELLEQGYPVIHTVGRASVQEPRLIDLRWGNPDHPKLTLVGKGVCFDSGGLDLKTSSGMLYMRKDMAGGAHVLGLAWLIMAKQLPVRLRVLVPAVENAVSGNAYRPGDIIRSRQGLSIEVTNTDAEGRLVLSDALTEACSENPDLIIDIATLTGAARVALGTEISAVFSDNDQLFDALNAAASDELDPIWRLPLYRPYRKLLDSKVADIKNACLTPFSAQASVAALFLREFVDEEIDWLHFDIMAWNSKSMPGRPEGGEAFAIRALFNLLQQRYG